MNILDFKRMKSNQEKITMVTCYDYPSAKIVSDSSINCVLVGDSVAMVVHGHDNTLHATMDMMVPHTQSVPKGLTNKFLVTDLPFLSHRMSTERTIENVKRLIQAGANAIKIEGADQDVCQAIEHIARSGVPVMGHLGLTPQHLNNLGGFKAQGIKENHAKILLEDAKKLEQAGCFSLVLECIPNKLAKEISSTLSIPTTGIGAGPNTDGQVLVWHDVLGIQHEFNPRFIKQFIDGKLEMTNALNRYAFDVRSHIFPTLNNTW